MIFLQGVSLTFVLLGLMACVPEAPNKARPAISSLAAKKMVASSGLPPESVVVLIQVDKRIAIYLKPKIATSVQLKNAPKNVCAQLGRSVRKVEPIEPSHPNTIDNTDYLVFHCT